jgi:choline dehydrogenase-like flavoprotein
LTAETDTIVIGAGPAGLAVGAVLRRAGVPFVMLERAGRVGESWHHHYDRLHLHTPKSHSALPFRAFPRTYPRYPSRQQVVEYLDDYARVFELAPEFGRDVQRCVRGADDVWDVTTDAGRSTTSPAAIFEVVDGFDVVLHAGGRGAKGRAIAVKDNRPAAVGGIDDTAELGQHSGGEGVHVQAFVFGGPQDDGGMIAVPAHPAGEVLAAMLHPVGVLGHENLPARVNGALIDDEHAQFIANF